MDRRPPGSGCCPQLRPPAATNEDRCPLAIARFESTSWRSTFFAPRRNGFADLEATADQVEEREAVGTGDGGGHPPPVGPARSAMLWRPIRGCTRLRLINAGTAQLAPHARHAVGSVGRLPDLAHQLDQVSFLDLAFGRLRGLASDPFTYSSSSSDLSIRCIYYELHLGAQHHSVADQ